MKNTKQKYREALRPRIYRILRRSPFLTKMYLGVRSNIMRYRTWWLRNNNRYGLWWRVGNAAAAGLMITAVILPIAQDIFTNNSYKLSADSLKLVGKTDETLAKQLSYDSQSATYQFNKDGIRDDSTNPALNLKSQVGTATGSQKDKSLYSLDVSTDFSKGITFHDVNSGLSFAMKPTFSGQNGKEIDKHLVFPLSSGVQAVYTLKNNGLKEDIVVPEVTSNTLSFEYKLDLPKTLAIKTIPNGDGSIGVYAADPVLYSDMQYGSKADKDRVEIARQKADKTSLVFGLPAPVVKDIKGKVVGSSRFELEGNTLRVVATDLTGIQGPITIDPSVVVTSTGDFARGNNEGMIDFGTSGQISRGGLTGASINGGWTTSTNTFSTARYSQGSAAYNGYLYIVGGQNSAGVDLSDIQYAAINSDGTLGTWQTNTTSLPRGTAQFGLVIYNGYMYVVGGNVIAAPGITSDTVFAQINSGGSVGTWATTTAFTTARQNFQATAYNGYIYMAGGLSSGNTYNNDVQYAPINANGTLGTWTTSGNSFANGRHGLGVVTYNGYLYIVGGRSPASSYNDIQYAPLGSDGSVGAFQTAVNSFATARQFMGVTIYNGYMYVTAGNKASIDYSDTQYAQINANGSVGMWQTTASLASGRYNMSTAIYNGYLYVLGGTTSTPTYFSDVQYAKIDPAGTTTGWSTTTSIPSTSGFPKTTTNAGSVAYGGYIYQIGGYQQASSGYSTVCIYAPLNSDGSIGSWSITSPLATKSGGFGIAMNNNVIYVLGGNAPAGVTLDTVQYTTINSDGTLNTWATTTSLPNIIANQGAAVYNNFIYMAGNHGGSSRAIQYAPINSDNTLGSWTSVTTALQQGRTYSSLIAVNGYLYAIGGADVNSSVLLTSTEYAVINSDGSLGTFAYTTSLNVARSRFVADYYDGYIYVSGGSIDFANTTQTATVEFAKVNSNGGLSSWQYNTSIPQTVNNQSSTFYNGFWYSLGGIIGGARSTAVYYAQVNNGGSGAVTSWASTGTAFSNGRTGSRMLANNGYLYVLGGRDASSYYNDVQYTAITGDGTTTGSWSTTTSMSSFTSGRSDFAAAIYNGFLYVMGGKDAGANYADVHYAPINSNGTLGSWSSGSSFTNSRYSLGGAVYNSKLYVLGGSGSSCSAGFCKDVQYATINDNGSIGSWSSTSSFTTGRYSAATTLYGGYAYIMGGTTSAGITSSTETAPINTDGTLGTWVSGVRLVGPRSDARTVVYNGYIYLIGGYDGTNAETDVEVSPIDGSGVIEDWNAAVNQISGARYGHSMTLYNGVLYVAGGLSSGVYKNDVQASVLQSIARVAHYSFLINLLSAANITGVSFNGTVPNATRSLVYRAAGSDGIFGATTQTSSISGSGGCLGTLLNTQYIWVSITLDDSAAESADAYFPDANGTPSNVTDVTISYNAIHPAPNIRLRGGQTLQQGSLSAFDTCYP